MATFVYPPPAPSQPPVAKPEKVDYSNLPCPVAYEEIHREASGSLKAELFEGMRFDFIKPVNQKFALSHSVSMGPMELPSQSSDIIKTPTAVYEFGATFADPKGTVLVGRILTDGRLQAHLKYDLSEKLSVRGQAQLTSEPHMSNGIANFNYKGSDYRAQLQLGNNGLFGASYIQSVTPRLSLGSEMFWSGEQRKSGVGYGARYNTDKTIASAQVASNGLAMLYYLHKITDKVSLASDFVCNFISKDVTASFGYDCNFRQSRLRGRVDSNGCVSGFLEESLNMGLRFVLSAEIDHLKKDYKFGFGMTVNE